MKSAWSHRLSITASSRVAAHKMAVGFQMYKSFGYRKQTLRSET